jgi:hypothetical protein
MMADEDASANHAPLPKGRASFKTTPIEITEILGYNCIMDELRLF